MGLEAQPARRGAKNRRKAARWRKRCFRLTVGLIFGSLRVVETPEIPYQANSKTRPLGGFCFSGSCVLQNGWQDTGRDSARITGKTPAIFDSSQGICDCRVIASRPGRASCEMICPALAVRWRPRRHAPPLGITVMESRGGHFLASGTKSTASRCPVAAAMRCNVRRVPFERPRSRRAMLP
jgi:hypothetical protein